VTQVLCILMDIRSNAYTYYGGFCLYFASFYELIIRPELIVRPLVPVITRDWGIIENTEEIVTQVLCILMDIRSNIVTLQGASNYRNKGSNYYLPCLSLHTTSSFS
jgi:hypothetical protein